MEEPKLEDYGIDKKDFDHIEKRNDKAEIILGTCGVIIGVVGLAISEFEEGSLISLLFFAVLGVFGGMIFFAPILIGLYYIYSNLFDKKYKKVKKYKEAKEKYNTWWIRIQLEFWRSLSGRRFEQELAFLYSKQGYKASLTPSTDDRGIDIILQKGNKNIIVQCKAHKKPLGPAIARELYGTLISSGAHEAYLASVSGFSKGTIDFVNDKPIKLVSLEEIINMQKSTTN